MPVRRLAIFVALLATTVGVLALAWLHGSDLYFLLPSYRHRSVWPPPTNPDELAMILAATAVVAAFSRHYGLVMFTFFPIGLLLGSIVGYLVFEWTSSLLQLLLVFVSATASVYGWYQHEYFDY